MKNESLPVPKPAGTVGGSAGRDNDMQSKPGPAGNRREFLNKTATAAMLTGLAAGYGTLGFFGLRFLLPQASGANLGWQYVGNLAELADFGSLQFTAASGAKIVIARHESSDAVAAFLALSSVCPHLGCQVFWETARERFFCPCHNGTFDAAGVATSGPPADAGQSLTQYDTKIESGILYVLAPLENVTRSDRNGRDDA